MSRTAFFAPPPEGVHTYVRDGGRVQPDAAASVAADLLHWATAGPDRPFLTWCPRDGGATVLTYGELERYSRRLATLLGGRVGPSRLLALLPANDLPSVVAIVTALRTGTPCLFLNPQDPVRRLRSVLADCPADLVLRSPYAAPQAAEFAQTVPWDPTAWDDAERTDGTAPEGTDDAAGCADARALPATHPALLFGTSGSTAASKLVVQSHRALTSNAEAVRRHHGLTRHRTLMGGLPLHHVNGVHFTLVAALHAGAHTVLPQAISPYTYRELLDQHRPDIVSLVPPVLEMLLATGRGWRPPDNLRYFVSAAAPLTSSLVRRVVDAFGVRVLQGYGLSETTNFSTTVPADASEETYRAVALDAGIPSVGVPLHGNEVEVFAEDGTLLGEGAHGEIRMRGHNVMEGYAHRPDLTDEAFAGGWFRSGDLGYWAAGPDGRRYFYITGRGKNIAKVRGETVSLEEVERALLSVDSVTDAGCVALPHPAWGEQVVALVATRSDDLDTVKARLAELVPPVALPVRWLRLDTVPRTATGKLQRPRLADIAREEAATS
ncbi:class I adenylate-forming enzyme family protein [Actinacidiphila yeochonensis]|uniref:class I adenylate-forming enzyme family protein n=1 Tax=Actinacidiphila yeochonensis TaxID=89050 RepID=UPI00068FAE54|nr:class I adenylate-forming enzyme family protein [Actinacidiphila yeochonensis]